MIIKEYENEKTKVRIHDDFVDKNEEKKIREILISLMINFLKNNCNN